MEFESEFSFGQRVCVDQDRDLVGFVTGFLWKDSDGHSVEVSWMHNGAAHTGWFQPWRLKDST